MLPYITLAAFELILSVITLSGIIMVLFAISAVLFAVYTICFAVLIIGKLLIKEICRHQTSAIDRNEFCNILYMRCSTI